MRCETNYNDLIKSRSTLKFISPKCRFSIGRQDSASKQIIAYNSPIKKGGIRVNVFGGDCTSTHHLSPQSLASLAVILYTCILVGCDNNSYTDANGTNALFDKKRPEVIAFVGAARRDPLWPILKASGQEYVNTLCSMEVRFLQPKGDSPQDQINLLNSLTAPEIQGLCIQINHVTAVEPTLRQLYARGMRIVSIGQPAPQDLRVAHVGYDERAIGRALAEATASVVNENGTIMLLHAGFEHPVYSLRLIGFQRKLNQIEVLANIDCKMDPIQARSIIRDRFARFPRLSAWVSLDDWPLRGMGLVDRPLPKGCRLITFGGTPSQWPLIRDGTCPAIVSAHYRDMGAKAIQYCEMAMRTPERPKERYIANLRTIWSTNLDAYIADWNAWQRQETPIGSGQIDTDNQTDDLPAWLD